MPLMHSLRSFVLRTTAGHVIPVKEKEPVFIPPAILKQAMEAGLAPVETGDLPQDEAKAVLPEGDVRLGLIKDKIEEFVLRDQEGEKGLFSGAGAPQVAELSKEVGFKVTAGERDEVWGRVRTELLASGG